MIRIIMIEVTDMNDFDYIKKTYVRFIGKPKKIMVN